MLSKPNHLHYAEKGQQPETAVRNCSDGAFESLIGAYSQTINKEMKTYAPHEPVKLFTLPTLYFF